MKYTNRFYEYEYIHESHLFILEVAVIGVIVSKNLSTIYIFYIYIYITGAIQVINDHIATFMIRYFFYYR